METVIFLVKSPHMKHKHCFAVKVDCKENKGRNSVDSHRMTGKFNRSCNNVDPHMSNKMVEHMVVTCFICIFCIVGAHKIEKHTERSFGKKSKKMIKFAPKHDEGSGGANHCSHDGKGETAGFTVKKIKSGSDEKKTEKIKKVSDFVLDNVKRCKHKAHTDDNRNCAFKFKLVFFHFLIIPLKNSFVEIIKKVYIYL